MADVNSIRKIIDNTIWDEGMVIIGKIMENDKFYINCMQDIYYADKEYKQLKVTVEKLEKEAKELENNFLRSNSGAKASNLSVNRKPIKKRLERIPSTLQNSLHKIKVVRQQADETAKNLAEQSVERIYQARNKKNVSSQNTSFYSDYKYLTRSLHYNYATSNRDTIGSEATAAIDAFFKYKLGPMSEITAKLYDIYSVFTHAAAMKEKCLSPWSNPVTSEMYKNYINENKSHYKVYNLINIIQGKSERSIFGKKMAPDYREGLLSCYVEALYHGLMKLNELKQMFTNKFWKNSKNQQSLTKDDYKLLAEYENDVKRLIERCQQEIDDLKELGFERTLEPEGTVCKEMG